MPPNELKAAVAICFLIGTNYILHGAGSPRALSAREAARELATTNSFSCHSLAFYNDKLYAAVPAGLLEIESGSVKRLYQWDKDYSQLHGVWNDTANGLLWVCLYDGNKLANYDGRTWREVKFPKPLHGYISRGDTLTGFRGVSNRRSFWLEGAGRAWRWGGTKSGKWTEETLPSGFHPDTWVNRPLKAVMATNRNVFFVKRGDQDYDWRLALLDDARMKSHPKLLQQLEEKIQGDSVWYLASGQWIAVTNNEGKFFAEESAVGNGKGYLRTEKGELFEVVETGISRLKTPGACEAIAASSTRTLLASFRGLGVFELKEEWQKLLTSPYSDSERDYGVRLAAQVGCIALAVTPQPQRQLSGANSSHTSTATLVYNSHPGMWISQGQEWKPISLPAAQ